MKPSDITTLEKENVELKEQLQEVSFQRDKYQRLFEVSADALSILDLETGKFIECNQAAIDMHGVESERNFLNLTPADISPEFQPGGGSSHTMAMDRIARAASEGPQIFQWTHSRLDASTFPCLVSLAALSVNGRNLILAIGRDITEITDAQKKLQNAHQVALVGQLSAGVCHDLNNVLHIISGNAELIQFANGQQEISEYSERIEQGIARAKSVTDRLLKLARPRKREVTRFNLDDVIEEELNFYQDATPNEIHIESSLNSDVQVEVDINTLKDSAINLIINAQNATKGIGTIKLETYSTNQFGTDVDLVFCSPREAKQYACLLVRDNGSGIQPELLNTIFDPFYSGQKDARGSGLGLSVVSAFSINNECGLTVSSTVDQGTEFCIWMPVTDRAKHQEIESDALPQKPLEGAFVVVVEDEEELLDVFATSFEIAGAKVARFSDPLEAKDYIEDHSDSVNILQSDQSLGIEMRGSDLIKWANDNFPKITTVLLTGYSSDENLTDLNSLILEKPISSKDLHIAIAKARQANPST